MFSDALELPGPTYLAHATISAKVTTHVDKLTPSKRNDVRSVCKLSLQIKILSIN